MVENSPQDRSEEIIAAIRSHWKGNQRCPVCRSNNWTLGEISAIPSFDEPNVDFGCVHPTVPVVCLVCGNTLLFSAMVMGVVAEPAQPGGRSFELDYVPPEDEL
jgi:predicted nucleic-acid-binding Zn-ribbon protein